MEVSDEKLNLLIQSAIKQAGHNEPSPRTLELLEELRKDFFHGLKDLHEPLTEIKTQVKLTNGRVNALENWKWFITGGLAIITVLVIPVLFKLL